MTLGLVADVDAQTVRQQDDRASMNIAVPLFLDAMYRPHLERLHTAVPPVPKIRF